MYCTMSVTSAALTVYSFSCACSTAIPQCSAKWLLQSQLSCVMPVPVLRYITLFSLHSMVLLVVYVFIHISLKISILF